MAYSTADGAICWHASFNRLYVGSGDGRLYYWVADHTYTSTLGPYGLYVYTSLGRLRYRPPGGDVHYQFYPNSTLLSSSSKPVGAIYWWGAGRIMVVGDNGAVYQIDDDGLITP